MWTTGRTYSESDLKIAESVRVGVRERVSSFERVCV